MASTETEKTDPKQEQLIGPLRIPLGLEPIIDADEEVFLLYTELQRVPSSIGGHGLGHIDSRADVLSVRFELTDAQRESDVVVSKRGKKKSRKGANKVGTTEVEIRLAQNTTALRSRNGDTGSVLWRISFAFVQQILQWHHEKATDKLFDFDVLCQANVIELGAGTGLVSILLSPLVKHYTVTDLGELLPLITKNISLNGLRDNIAIAELDWLNLPPAPRLPTPPNTGLDGRPGYDLILALDTIYHPALLPAFVNTLDVLATAGQTAVLVGVELRAEEVAREFLDRWCHLGSWTVCRLGETGWSLPFVFWLGHKNTA